MNDLSSRHPGSPEIQPQERVKRYRVDRGVPSATARGSLLRAFRVWGPSPRKPALNPPAGAEPAPVPLERRAEPRHRQPECHAWVGWKTFRQFQMRDALLIDLSRGGARIFLDECPPTGRPLWLFLETPDQKAIIKVTVRGAEIVSGGQCLVRVQFEDRCPYALFEAAVCGLTAADPRQRITQRPLANPHLTQRRGGVLTPAHPASAGD